MKLHPRTLIVQQAEAEMFSALVDAEKKHSLTPAETVGILLSIAQQQHKYILRYDRHGNYEQKADEA